MNIMKKSLILVTPIFAFTHLSVFAEPTIINCPSPDEVNKTTCISVIDGGKCTRTLTTKVEKGEEQDVKWTSSFFSIPSKSDGSLSFS
jgi:hypothetical protein